MLRHVTTAGRLSAVLALVLAACSTRTAVSERAISLAVLRDKVEGGWAGQMIGVAFGAPTEFRSLEKIIEGPLPDWKPENIANALNQTTCTSI